MLPLLVNIPTEESICSDDKLVDKISAVIGGLVNADGIVTIKEIEMVESRLVNFFGIEAKENLEAGVKVLYNILTPPPNTLTAIKEMCKEINDKGVINRCKEDYMAAFIDIIEEGRQINLEGVALLEILFKSLDISNYDINQRIQNLINKYPDSNIIEKKKILDYVGGVGNLIPKALQHSNKDSLISRANKLNKELFKVLDVLENIAWSIDDNDLKKEIRSFISLMEDLPFKIVICGEIKNGKSSLFNALLGKNASPVKEGIPATGAILKLEYAKSPDFSGLWMDSHQINRLESYLNNNAGGSLEADLLQNVSQIKLSPYFKEGGCINSIRSLEDFADYISVEGKFTSLVKEITFKSDIHLLKNKAILVDTPGLNDSIGVRTDFSMEESLTADCIIFVLNAISIGRHSEKLYLEQLLNSGKAINLVVVVNRIDLLPNSNAEESVLEYAKQWVEGIITASSNIQLFGPVATNAKEAMDKNLKESLLERKDSSGFSELKIIIEEILSEDKRNEAYRKKLHQRFSDLEIIAEQKCDMFFQKANTSMPSSQVLHLLEKNTNVIKRNCEELVKSVQLRLDSVIKEAELTTNGLIEQVDEAKQSAITAIRSEIERKVRLLGDQKFANQKYWKDFDQKVTLKVVGEPFQKVQERVNRRFDAWERELESFGNLNKREITNKIEILKGGAEEMIGVCSESEKLTHISSIINSTIKDGEKLVLGLISGHMLTGGRASIAKIGTTIATTTVTPITASLFAIPMIAYAALRFFTSVEKNKSSFIDRKIKKIENILNEKTALIRQELNSAEDEITQIFIKSTEKQYTPIIKESLLLILYNKLYLEAIKATQNSCDQYKASIEAQFDLIKEIEI